VRAHTVASAGSQLICSHTLLATVQSHNCYLGQSHLAYTTTERYTLQRTGAGLDARTALGWPAAAPSARACAGSHRAAAPTSPRPTCR
jgi:hypothetical protein